MNPRNQWRIAICMIALFCIIISCNKDNNSSNTNQTTVQTQADDQTMVSNESDIMASDINAALSSSTSINGMSANTIHSGIVGVNSVNETQGVQGVNSSLICDAVIVVDTTVNPRTVTITYNGTNCWGNRTRTGTVVISIAAGTHWMDQGAVVNIAVQSLTITRVSDGKTIILNGTRTMTNVSGGSMTQLATLNSIIHTISDSLTITFADNLVRTWQVSKKRVFTYNNGIVMTTTGTHSDGVNTNVAEWGTNRFGTAFESLITIPKVFRQDCNFRLVSGQNTILRSDSLNSVITFGLDATGHAAACPGSGNYYLEITWTFPNGKSTIPIILPY
ncbi:MAG TPA: hypothetical protein VGZ90_10155 [Puia sp.]|nr:hypothetical protein [Puia sp.]